MTTITDLEINQLFEKEFGFVSDRFKLIQFPITQISHDRDIYKPGIYIFHMNGRVWKVGKSNDNVFKRALDHFKADTGHRIEKGMKKFQENPEMNLMLYVLKSNEDMHWVYALEACFELKFRNMDVLEIRSARLG